MLTLLMMTLMGMTGADGTDATGGAACLLTHKEIQGKSLNGVIKPGQDVEVYAPDCLAPSRYDFIIFRTDASDNLVIKQIWGLPGDMMTVGDDGSININGERALTPYDRPYILMGLFRKKMKALEGPLKGYLALGHPGSIDSGKIGPIDREDIVGVVKAEAGRARQLQHN